MTGLMAVTAVQLAAVSEGGGKLAVGEHVAPRTGFHCPEQMLLSLFVSVRSKPVWTATVLCHWLRTAVECWP